MRSCVRALLGLCLCAAVSAPLPVAAQSAPFCAAGQTPAFQLGFASLRSLLGTRMGDPVECEHPDPATGDTLQHTTTGLAFFRKSANLSTFTNGGEHWAAMPRGLGHWTGVSADPPQATPEDVAYLVQVAPVLSGFSTPGEELQTLGARLTAGQIDLDDAAAELQSIRGEFDDLTTQLSSLQPSPQLARGHQALANGLVTLELGLSQLQDALSALQRGDVLSGVDLATTARSTVQAAAASVQDGLTDFVAFT